MFKGREKCVTGGEGVAQPVAAKDTGHSVRLERRDGFQSGSIGFLLVSMVSLD